MERTLRTIALILLIGGFASAALALDTVYLKDGSIVHGTIIEEVPNKSIKIETKDGNVFVYKMNSVSKITHSSAAQVEDQGDDQQVDQEETVAPPPKVHKKKKKAALSQTYESTDTAPAPIASDPHARFSKFALTVNCGVWAPYINTEFNDSLEAFTGTNAYDYFPGWFHGGMGLGWFTNNIALKWNFQFSYQPNNYQTDWYYGGYYAGTTEEDTAIISLGSEMELDLGLDSIINADNVTTVYVPLIGGFWAQEWDYYDSSGGSATFSNTTTDFGSGIGIRGFDSSNFLWDFQLVYRVCSRGNYLTDASGYMIPSADGSYIDANVSGLDLNFMVGFLFK